MRTVALSVAIEQAKKFTDLLPGEKTVSPETKESQTLHCNAEYFNKEDIEAILSQKGCEGIRIYHALDNDERSILLIVGATKDRDLLTPVSGRIDSTDNIILCSEENLRCPPMCATEGLLNNP